MNKKLVAYFSASGVTAAAAKNLARLANADLFEIKPEVPYTEADLNWNNKQSRSSVEMADKTFRPKVAEPLDAMSEYDTIYLGFPIWWYVAPTIINTFLEDRSTVETDPSALRGLRGRRCHQLAFRVYKVKIFEHG